MGGLNMMTRYQRRRPFSAREMREAVFMLVALGAFVVAVMAWMKTP